MQILLNRELNRQSQDLSDEHTTCLTPRAGSRNHSLANFDESMLTRKFAGDEWIGCELVSCGGYGFARVGSRGSEGVTV